MSFSFSPAQKPILTAALLGLLASSAFWVGHKMPNALAGVTPPQNTVNADLIRVGISDDDMNSWEYPQARISSNGPFTVLDKTTGLPVLTAQPGEIITFTVDRSGFAIKSNLQHNLKITNFTQKPNVNDIVPDMNALAVPPDTNPSGLLPLPGPLRVETQNPGDRLKVMNITRRKVVPEFRGALEIVRGNSSPNKLTVINELEMEDYLKAVVPNELPMRYGLEAVKAQAIAARNYAIRPRENPWHTFDICDSQLCQVYFGSQTETPDSNRAIAGTQGMVALYDGKPILALFSSSHGGYAEDYSNAFSDPLTKQYPAPPIPYLSGGPDVPISGDLDLRTEAGARKFWTDPNMQSFDVDSPYYRWNKGWNRMELENTLNHGLADVSQDGSTRNFISPLFRPGSSIGTFKSVDVLERGVSGKAMVVQINGSNGSWTIKKEFLIRKVFKKDGKMLPSANLVFTPQKDLKGHLIGLTAQGGGFGHGVGLSQLGASWMHKHGYVFPQIIQHYYKGVSLGTLPITVGGQKASKAIMTQFGANQARGTLWLVQEAQESSWIPFHKAAPVSLEINGKPVRVNLDTAKTSLNVDSYINPGQLNSLLLLPDEKHPERKVKAWIELYQPQTVSLKPIRKHSVSIQ